MTILNSSPIPAHAAPLCKLLFTVFFHFHFGPKSFVEKNQIRLLIVSCGGASLRIVRFLFHLLLLLLTRWVPFIGCIAVRLTAVSSV